AGSGEWPQCVEFLLGRMWIGYTGVGGSAGSGLNHSWLNYNGTVGRVSPIPPEDDYDDPIRECAVPDLTPMNLIRNGQFRKSTSGVLANWDLVNCHIDRDTTVLDPHSGQQASALLVTEWAYYTPANPETGDEFHLSLTDGVDTAEITFTVGATQTAAAVTAGLHAAAVAARAAATAPWTKISTRDLGASGRLYVGSLEGNHAFVMTPHTVNGSANNTQTLVETLITADAYIQAYSGDWGSVQSGNNLSTVFGNWVTMVARVRLPAVVPSPVQTFRIQVNSTSADVTIPQTWYDGAWRTIRVLGFLDPLATAAAVFPTINVFSNLATGYTATAPQCGPIWVSEIQLLPGIQIGGANAPTYQQT
ncbi:MAG: hypothetical protein V2A79_14995, partial [Planctomycetota bacterium]